MEKISKFSIYIPNCLIGGNAYLNAKEELENSIREELGKITGLQMKGVYSNVVRGSHSSFSLVVTGVIYDYKQLQLEVLVKYAISKIKGLFFSEVRIEHMRVWHTISEAASILNEQFGISF